MNREEMIQILLDKIPIILDINTLDLKYDTRSIYFKIYLYIRDLEEKRGVK